MNSFTEDLLKENIVLSEKQVEDFRIFYSLLISENKITNLTRITEENDVYYLHFYDSLMCIKAIDLSQDDIKLLDVGAGPGFPSIPLKIAVSKLEITIVEATNKKVIFINKVIDELRLDKISANHLRAEDYTSYNSFDYVTTRAVSTIKDQLKYTIPFLKIGGVLISMKGSKALEEIKESDSILKDIGAMVEKIIPYTVLDRSYNLVLIKKIKDTPKKYLKTKNKGK